MPSRHRAKQLMDRARDEEPAIVDRVKHLVHVIGMTNRQCARELHTCPNYVGAIRKTYNITLPDGRWHRFHPVAAHKVDRPDLVLPVAYLDEPEARIAGQLEQLMDREKRLLCPEFSKWLQRLCVLLTLLLPVHASAHDWYSDLRNARGGSCCNGKDCREVAECITPKKREGLELKPGVCSPIDYSRVLPMPSPDGKSHACTGPSISEPGGVAARCIVLGASA